jgi:hypothetical protein
MLMIVKTKIVVMDNIIRYIEEITGVKMDLAELGKEELKSIPFYILNDYKIWKGKLFEKELLLMEKITSEHFTPLQYQKQMKLIELKLQNPVVFLLPEIKPYDRNRLVQKQVNFIIENKQMFIPQLLIDFKEYRVTPLQSTFLKPAAQTLLLYQLQRRNLNGLNYKQIAGLLNYRYLTISRAVENLLRFGICKTEGTKEKTVVFEMNKKELWEKALPFMRTPIRKKVFINDVLPDELVFKTNMNALAFYTNLNDDGHTYYAIGHANFLKLKNEKKIQTTSNYDGDYIIEVWRYNPAILTDNNYVDPLSLYLAYKDSEDERIGMALEQVIKDYIW